MTHLTIITATVTNSLHLYLLCSCKKHHHKELQQSFMVCGYFTKQLQLNVYFDKCGQHIVDE